MRTEAHKLKLENEWLKGEIMKHNGGQPVELPPSIFKQVSLPAIKGSSAGGGPKGFSGPGQRRAPEFSDMDDIMTEMSKPDTPHSQVGE